ncbi:CPXCG motif-containing cysteine-rich protein [Idiomarina xiamenensis]|uniref:Zn-ribbon protein n=1 Tax=Idiomarina xiamenensis 10-D-4 TaxID=740709 RepID=K2JTW4_9GAMM|nr:CPXCG motif-containing cysteine-rich protein [Idiomarina xiamenensis]EKE86886.1 Zn-ribbon protein [Idiomarina xiamenensis 10-D-4]
MLAQKLVSHSVACPYCGHHIHLAIDASAGDQDYQDECAACGDSIHVFVQGNAHDDGVEVRIEGNDEQFY